jgi:adenylate cyclase
MSEPDETKPVDGLDASHLDLPRLLERFETTLLGGPRKYDRIQVSEAAGIDPDDARALWRALGFAMVDDHAIVFTDGDVAALRDAKFLTDHAVIDADMRNAITRMFGQTFSRLAAWQGQLLVELLLARPELMASEQDIGRFVEELLPVIENTQSFVWRRQLASYFSRMVSHETVDLPAAGLASTVVGFADMSGFTTLTRKATEAELREVLGAFEAATTEVVGANNGRIVKTIGDEVLFVADAPADGAEIALGLHAAATADEYLPPLRVGLAAGPVVSRLGDVYGSTVNIASRLTTVCRPGWVLVDRVMAESLQGDARYTLKPRRPESVRGFHHLRTWRLRRAEQRSRPRGG